MKSETIDLNLTPTEITIIATALDSYMMELDRVQRDLHKYGMSVNSPVEQRWDTTPLHAKFDRLRQIVKPSLDDSEDSSE